jgi:hypothetical protein
MGREYKGGQKVVESMKSRGTGNFLLGAEVRVDTRARVRTFGRNINDEDGWSV